LGYRPKNGVRIGLSAQKRFFYVVAKWYIR
jgi:hypothetical protein